MNQEYHHDKFYNVHNLDLKVKLEIIYDAKNCATEWWVDELDCSKSFARQKIDMSFEDILKKFTNAALFNVVNRRGHNDPWYGEISFRAMEPAIDYFLWINVTQGHLDRLIEKYNLKSH
jgi:hypothetical protein